MSFATVAGFPVVDLKLALPLNGVWNCQLSCIASQLPQGPVHLVIGDGHQITPLDLTGHVLTQGSPLDTLVARLCGGVGNMDAMATPTHYSQTTVGQVLNDVLAAAGETASSSIDASLLSQVVDYWTVMGQPCAWVLRQMLDFEVSREANYRVLPDGTIWIGVETWPQASQQIVVGVTQPMPHLQRDEVEHEVGEMILPGVTWEGNKVNRVQIDLRDEKVRSTVLYE